MPRYYATNIHPTKLHNDILKGFKNISNIKNTYFYTTKGIFIIEKGGLCQITQLNEPEPIKHNVNDYNIIEDKRDRQLIPVTSQLPYDYHVKRSMVSRYSLGNSILVIEKTGEYFTDFYIESEHPITRDILQKDIVSFLSQLN